MKTSRRTDVLIFSSVEAIGRNIQTFQKKVSAKTKDKRSGRLRKYLSKALFGFPRSETQLTGVLTTTYFELHSEKNGVTSNVAHSPILLTRYHSPAATAYVTRSRRCHR